ncbi:MAG: nodulation protein NfeD [Burkholderiales bacterium]|nr:nodulation protein NfeD [Burkholderiales bacterium]
MRLHMLNGVARLSIVVLALFAGFAASASAYAQENRALVYVVPIEGMIDLGLAPFVERVIAEATQAGAAAVVVEINTFGGRVDAAVQIRDALLNSRVRTVAYVNKRAISAGALIGLAAEKLVMAGGGTIGAATPVQMGQPGEAALPVSEKTVSYVRTEFRATAESRKRPPRLAEAMVDADVAIEGVIEKGKLLTLTTEEALKHKLIDFRADTMDSALQQLGLEGAELRRTSLNWAEHLIRWLTNPVVSSLLISIGMIGIFVELRTPGFGFPGGIGIASLALFFWGHWLVQLVGWEELLLALGGVMLLALEVLVIPGFGVAGILGIVAILAGLVLSLVGAGDTSDMVVRAAGRVVFSLLLALTASLVLLRFLPHLPFGRRLILQADLGAGHAHGSAPDSDLRWLGKKGQASSPLRPAGIAEIEGERVDVVSEGDLIEPGQAVEVTRVEGNRIVVRRVPHITTEGNDK